MGGAVVIPRLLVLMVLLAGCAPKRGNEYAVHIDPAFTAAETQAFLDGMGDWEANVRVKFWPEVGGCKGEQDGQVCVFVSGALGKSEGETIWALTSDANLHDGATIRVDVDLFRSGQLDATRFHQMAAHELGHALGLPHLPPGALMSAWYDLASHVVTPADAAEFDALRR